MAAVTTGQENAELQQAAAQPTASLPLAPVPAKRITSHSNLERDIHMRHWAEHALVGRTLTLQGADIIVSPAIDLHDPKLTPPWTDDGSKTLSRVSLFTATSKMGAPSYSLPVGPPSFGGSCPGSLAGMSTVPPAAYNAQKKVVLQVLRATNPGLPTPANYPPEDAVCQNCYVAKGNHAAYWGNNLRIVIRYAWTRAAVDQGLFASSIISALHSAEFPQEPPAIAHLKQRYFRIHDAGDFYSPQYLEAWWQIAKAYDGRTPGMPRTVFWSPTRIWATPWGNKAVARINGGSRFLDNFVIRPSGYVIDAPGPDYAIGPATGYASPTTVGRPKSVKAVLEGKAPPIFDWQCPAQEHSGSCLSSPNPMGSMGCRVCWVAPAMRVSYGLH